MFFNLIYIFLSAQYLSQITNDDYMKIFAWFIEIISKYFEYISRIYMLMF